MFDMFHLFISSHPLIFISALMFVCTCLLLSSHPYIIKSSGSYALACIPASSYPQVGVCSLVTSYPHILLSLSSSILCACWYPCILTLRYRSCHVLRVLVDILASSHPHILMFMYSGCLSISSHLHILISSGSCTLGAC